MPEVTKDFIRLPVKGGVKDGEDVRTITVGDKSDGIEALYATGAKEIRTFLFRRDKWDEAGARKWVADHQNEGTIEVPAETLVHLARGIVDEAISGLSGPVREATYTHDSYRDAAGFKADVTGVLKKLEVDCMTVQRSSIGPARTAALLALGIITKATQDINRLGESGDDVHTGEEGGSPPADEPGKAKDAGGVEVYADAGTSALKLRPRTVEDVLRSVSEAGRTMFSGKEADYAHEARDHVGDGGRKIKLMALPMVETLRMIFKRNAVLALPGARQVGADLEKAYEAASRGLSPIIDPLWNALGEAARWLEKNPVKDL